VTPRRRLVGIAVAAVVLATAVLLLTGGTAWREPASVEALRAELQATVDEADVPGAAVVVLHDGVVVASVYAGTARGGRPVGPDTVFQMASLSKPVAAYTVLRSGLDLDRPVDTGTWAFPPGPHEPSGVTLRRLLSHTAGTDVPGYLGYAAPGPLPGVRDSLDGRGSPVPDAPSSRVALTAAPGSGYRYSGGGFSVAQLAVETATGRPFAEAVAAATGPLGMGATGFACTTTPGAPQEAEGHDTAGNPLPPLRYPEAAAGGLCSTAPDYARFVAALLTDDPVATAMRTPAPATDGHYGLGLELGTLADGTPWFGHTGVNPGWHDLARAYPTTGWAFVALTDGDGGAALTDAVSALFTRRA
jgi:CubicO group peptidase (beta-lactamase class C family)